MMDRKLPEEPLFSKYETQPSNNKVYYEDDNIVNLRLKEEVQRNNIQRKNKILGFSMQFIVGLLYGVLAVMIIDIIVSRLEIESALIAEAFNLFKYCVSTTLGYIFGRETG